MCSEVVFDANELVCLQCDCSFESRNALLIAVREVHIMFCTGLAWKLLMSGLQLCEHSHVVFPSLEYRVQHIGGGLLFHATLCLCGVHSALGQSESSSHICWS